MLWTNALPVTQPTLSKNMGTVYLHPPPSAWQRHFGLHLSNLSQYPTVSETWRWWLTRVTWLQDNAIRAAAVGSRVDYIRLLALFVISFLLNCVSHGSPLNYCRFTDSIFAPAVRPSVRPPVCVCLSVSTTSQVLNGFGWNFMDGKLLWVGSDLW